MKKQNLLGEMVKKAGAKAAVSKRLLPRNGTTLVHKAAGKQAEHEGIPMNFNAFFCISTTATYYDQSINKCPNMR